MTNEALDDPFDGHRELPGLEHLGRAIVDDDGVPSGSPANFENLRGRGPSSISEEARSRIFADLAAEFPAP